MDETRRIFVEGGLTPDAVLTANDALITGVIRALPKNFKVKIITGQDADIAGLKSIFRRAEHDGLQTIAPLAKGLPLLLTWPMERIREQLFFSDWSSFSKGNSARSRCC